jgi:dolichol-phosphate mannosyltransferase
MTVLAALGRVLLVLQAILGARIAVRMLRTAGSAPIGPDTNPSPPDACISVIVPVLNENARLQPCLDGLREQGDEVLEILIVDGGSTDGTTALARDAAALDGRIKVIETPPIPRGWNGKAWGLEHGRRRVDGRARWLLTIDADVRPRRGLGRALLAEARRSGVAAVSVATVQELAGAGVGWVHPAMLATLVYRHGIPGQVSGKPEAVQANGQCMLVDRSALDLIGGYARVAHSVCEDVTLARLLAAAGYTVGFHECARLVSTRMYETGLECWRNWSRSLPLRDEIEDRWVVIGLLEVLLVQALPGVVLALTSVPAVRGALPRGLVRLNLVLVVMRLATHVGLGRAYANRPWTYWLSPLLDLPVTLNLVCSAIRREHTWRGRRVIRAGVIRAGVIRAGVKGRGA